jgi:TrmH family RNA methyltransferase
MIQSPSNPRIKAWAKLRERRARLAQQRFLIEGVREIRRALQGGIAIELLIHAEQLSQEEAELLALPLPHLKVGPEALARLSTREHPGGLIALAHLPQRRLSDLPEVPRPFWLVALGVEKPGNLGALLRSAEALGASGAIVVGGADPWAPQAIRNSAGAVFTLPLALAEEEEAWGWLKRAGLLWVAAEPGALTPPWKIPFDRPVALLLGAEDRGLPERWRAGSHLQVGVPMAGAMDSLNVAVAASLLLYEALRQRTHTSLT